MACWWWIITVAGHWVKCRIHYCSAHLLRDVEYLRDEIVDKSEVQSFVTTAIPLLADAMYLNSHPLSDKQYDPEASKIKRQIDQAMKARHSIPACAQCKTYSSSRRKECTNGQAITVSSPIITAKKENCV